MTAQFLVQMSGVPGSGKSTMAHAIQGRTDAIVLDLDLCKSVALESGVEMETSGRVAYGTLWAFARSLLAQNFSVILDSPCRFQGILDAGLQIAQDTGIRYRYIECITQDMAEIRRRLQSRTPTQSQFKDIDNLPTVLEEGLVTLSEEERFRYWMRNMKRPAHDYLTLDTSRPIADCIMDVMAYLEVESFECGR